MWRRVWIWERKLKGSRSYCLRWHDDLGRIKTEGVGEDLRLARRLRVKRERELNDSKLKKVASISLEGFIAEEQRLLAGRLAEASLYEIRRVLRAFQRFCRHAMLDAISASAVEEFIAARLQKVCLATANRDLRTLKASFGRAVDRGHLHENPAGRVKAIREPDRRKRVLSSEELSKLLAACPTRRWQALVALAATTGMRRGELLALRWDDVDFDAATVWVSNRPGHLTKSRRNRTLGLIPEMQELLMSLPRRGDNVFCIQNGLPWRHNFSRDFRAIVKRAGIPHCTLHDLRRTFVSQLARAGVNQAIVQKLAGHASMATTLRFYTEIPPENMRSAQGLLPFGSVLRDISFTYHGPERARETDTPRVVTPAGTAS